MEIEDVKVCEVIWEIRIPMTVFVLPLPSIEIICEIQNISDLIYYYDKLLRKKLGHFHNAGALVADSATDFSPAEHASSRLIMT